MRFSTKASALAATALIASAVLSAPSFAAPAPAAAPAPQAAAPAAPPADPKAVVATVNGEKITVADVQDAVGNMPDPMRQLPPNVIYPMLINQLADQKAIQIAAH